MTRKNRHIRILADEEQSALDEINAQLKPYRFEVHYYNKDGKKNARRPWRIQMRNDSCRFFDTFEQLKKYADRVVFEHIEIDKMNTKLKLYSSKAHVEIRWMNNMPSYHFHKPIFGGLSESSLFRDYGVNPTRSAKKVGRRGMNFWVNINVTTSFDALVQRVGRELQERQAGFSGVACA